MRASVRGLETLLEVAYEFVRPEDDAVHEGSYSPDARDHAENARNVIFSQLVERPGADAFRAMQRLSSHPIFAARAHQLEILARGKAEYDADGPAWTGQETIAFNQSWAAPAKTGTDLLRIVLGVLNDISLHLTQGDVTSRPLLERAKDEDEVQNWLVEQLNARTKGRFHAFREAEVAQGDKPDVIAASTSAPCQVAIEAKHGGMGWTVRELEKALAVQLAEDYLKPEVRRHGVMVVTHHKDRRWQDPRTSAYMTFDQLIQRLDKSAKGLTENRSGAIEVACVGINAFKESAPPPKGKSRPVRTGGNIRRRKKKRKAVHRNLTP